MCRWNHIFPREKSNWSHGSVVCTIFVIHVYRQPIALRTNIVIDDELMEEALKLSGLETKKDAVELGLRTLVQLKRQEKLRKLRGKLKWDGCLSEQKATR